MTTEAGQGVTASHPHAGVAEPGMDTCDLRPERVRFGDGRRSPRAPKQWRGVDFRASAGDRGAGDCEQQDEQPPPNLGAMCRAGTNVLAGARTLPMRDVHTAKRSKGSAAMVRSLDPSCP
jgi:hypothetical protein